MELTEAKIQRRVIDKLEDNGWLVNKLIQTTLNGWPDLIAIKNGKCVFIECKAGTKKPDLLQALRHDKIRQHGVDVYLVNEKNYKTFYHDNL